MITWTRKEMKERARDAGVYISTYSPGDGVTRYRFTTENMNYFEANSSDKLFTALGLHEARVFLWGYLQGRA